MEQTQSAIAASAPDVRDTLRHRSLWGCAVANFCGAYTWFFILTWIPYYLVEARHWSMSGMALIGGICYLLVACALLTGGSLTDFWIRRGASATLARKTFLALSLAVVAMSMIGCALADNVLSVVFLIVGTFAWGLGNANIFAVSQTLAGTAAVGRWVGLQNGIGAFSGVVAPALTGILVDRTGNFVYLLSPLPSFRFAASSRGSLTIEWSQPRELVTVVAGATS